MKSVGIVIFLAIVVISTISAQKNSRTEKDDFPGLQEEHQSRVIWEENHWAVLCAACQQKLQEVDTVGL